MTQCVSGVTCCRSGTVRLLIGGQTNVRARATLCCHFTASTARACCRPPFQSVARLCSLHYAFIQAGGGGDDSVGTAWGWIRAHPFFRIPEDAVATLAADPERLQMYCDWHRYTGVPLLHKAAEIMKEQSHLARWPSVGYMQSAFPTVEWERFTAGGVTAQIRGHFVVYASEWALVLARWDRGDTSLLQPRYPNFMFPMVRGQSEICGRLRRADRETIERTYDYTFVGSGAGAHAQGLRDEAGGARRLDG